MKIVQVHNFYKKPGGEDQVFKNEIRLLKENGHDVIDYSVYNDEVDDLGKLAIIKELHWSNKHYEYFRSLFKKECPNVVHIHNTFPLISPSIYYAATEENVAVVQTLHNYRMLCPASTFYRDGQVCEKCLGNDLPWYGIIHKCYRNSYLASAATASMLFLHKKKNTFEENVDVFVTMTNFGKAKFIEGGLSSDKIMVKPHFIETDPGVGEGDGNYALFVGRLTEEKGVLTLLRAWEDENINLPLKVIGDGPLNSIVKKATNKYPLISWLGQCDRNNVLRMMGSATVLIVPSECYETFGLIVIEAFSKGTPVIVSDIGSVGELVENGVNGLKFNPGSSDDLINKIKLFHNDKDNRMKFRSNARNEYLIKYTPKQNYNMLMELYNKAISTKANK